MKNAIYVGASLDTVKTTGKTILDIINTPNAEAVKLGALEALKGVCGIENTTITNCHFESINLDLDED